MLAIIFIGIIVLAIVLVGIEIYKAPELGDDSMTIIIPGKKLFQKNRKGN